MNLKRVVPDWTFITCTQDRSYTYKRLLGGPLLGSVLITRMGCNSEEELKWISNRACTVPLHAKSMGLTGLATTAFDRELSG